MDTNACSHECPSDVCIRHLRRFEAEPYQGIDWGYRRSEGGRKARPAGCIRSQNYGSPMPSTAQAAIVFLLIVLPGFLAQGGYRFGRAVPEHPQGLVAVARVIAISALFALVAWKLGGRAIYDHARDGTALTENEGETYRFAIALFLAPGVL